MKEFVTMDWWRLIKSIIIALLLLAALALFVFVIVYGREHPWVIAVLFGLVGFAILVDKIYHSEMK